MKLSQLVAEATARLSDLRARHGAEADAECFVSFNAEYDGAGEADVQRVKLLTWDPTKPYFQIFTEKEAE